MIFSRREFIIMNRRRGKLKRPCKLFSETFRQKDREKDYILDFVILKGNLNKTQ